MRDELLELCGRARLIHCDSIICAAADLHCERYGGRADVLAASFRECELSRVLDIVSSPSHAGDWLRSLIGSFRPNRYDLQPIARVRDGDDPPRYWRHTGLVSWSDMWPAGTPRSTECTLWERARTPNTVGYMDVGYMWVIREVLIDSRARVAPGISPMFGEWAK